MLPVLLYSDRKPFSVCYDWHVINTCNCYKYYVMSTTTTTTTCIIIMYYDYNRPDSLICCSIIIIYERILYSYKFDAEMRTINRGFIA